MWIQKRQNFNCDKKTDHTFTTFEGKIIHKKLSSKPLNFQTSRKPDEQRKTISRCHRFGNSSSCEYCETHRRLRAEGDVNNNQADNDVGPSHSMPTMTSKKLTYRCVVMYGSSSRDSDSIVPNVNKDCSDMDSKSVETGLRADIGRQVETLRAQTPTMTSPIGCSTVIAPNTSQLDPSGTPIRIQETNTVIAEQGNKEGMTGKLRSKQVKVEIRNKVRFELEPRRSERIKTAKRVGKVR